MAIYTPRGLKIRMKVEQAFGFIGRLYPDVTAWQVLKTTEGIASLPAAFGFITAIIILLLEQPSPIIFIIKVVLASTAGLLFELIGIFPFRIYKVGEYYSYLAGYGVYLTIIFVLSFFVFGWMGPVLFMIAKTAAMLIEMIADPLHENYFKKRTGGMSLTLAEIAFLNAYLIYARRYNKSLRILLEPEEPYSENALTSFEQLVTSWPELARKFNRE